MGNGKVQTEQTQTSKPIRKGRLNIGLQKKTPTEMYGNIVIHHFIDEEIEWSTLAERHKKVMNWYTVMTTEFKEVHDKVMSELGLEQKRAFFDNPPNSPQSRAINDNLDNLDSIG